LDKKLKEQDRPKTEHDGVDYIDFSQIDAGKEGDYTELRKFYGEDTDKAYKYFRNNDEAQGAISFYTSDGYTDIRTYLSNKAEYGNKLENGTTCYGYSADAVQKYIDDLSEYITNNKIDRDVVLSRRINVVSNEETSKFFGNLKVGDVYQDKSFTSSSLLELYGFGEFNIKIFAKKGSNAACSVNNNEFEYVIEKGSKFKVIETKNNNITVELL